MTSNVNKQQILCVTLLVLILEGRMGLYVFSEIGTPSDSLTETELSEKLDTSLRILASNGSYPKRRREGWEQK